MVVKRPSLNIRTSTNSPPPTPIQPQKIDPVTKFFGDLSVGAQNTVSSYNVFDSTERSISQRPLQDVYIESALRGDLGPAFDETGRRLTEEPGKVVGEIATEAGIQLGTLGLGAAAKGAVTGIKVAKTGAKVYGTLGTGYQVTKQVKSGAGGAIRNAFTKKSQKVTVNKFVKGGKVTEINPITNQVITKRAGISDLVQNKVQSIARKKFNNKSVATIPVKGGSGKLTTKSIVSAETAEGIIDPTYAANIIKTPNTKPGFINRYSSIREGESLVLPSAETPNVGSFEGVSFIRGTPKVSSSQKNTLLSKISKDIDASPEFPKTKENARLAKQADKGVDTSDYSLNYSSDSFDAFRSEGIQTFTPNTADILSVPGPTIAYDKVAVQRAVVREVNYAIGEGKNLAEVESAANKIINFYKSTASVEGQALSNFQESATRYAARGVKKTRLGSDVGTGIAGVDKTGKNVSVLPDALTNQQKIIVSGWTKKTGYESAAEMEKIMKANPGKSATEALAGMKEFYIRGLQPGELPTAGERVVGLQYTGTVYGTPSKQSKSGIIDSYKSLMSPETQSVIPGADVKDVKSGLNRGPGAGVGKGGYPVDDVSDFYDKIILTQNEVDKRNNFYNSIVSGTKFEANLAKQVGDKNVAKALVKSMPKTRSKFMDSRGLNEYDYSKLNAWGEDPMSFFKGQKPAGKRKVNVTPEKKITWTDQITETDTMGTRLSGFKLLSSVKPATIEKTYLGDLSSVVKANVRANKNNPAFSPIINRARAKKALQKGRKIKSGTPEWFSLGF
jgi:hypothetical protein